MWMRRSDLKRNLAAVLAVASAIAFVSSRAGPAGVIPYACPGGIPHVLLAFDPAAGRVGYGAFDGGGRPGESVAETAAREMLEETRCAFGTPTAAELAGKTPSDFGGVSSYVAEVPFLSGRDIAEHPCEAALERVDWLWVRLTDLKTALGSDGPRPEVTVASGTRRIALWRGAAGSLRQAVSDGLLPDGLCRAGGQEGS